MLKLCGAILVICATGAMGIRGVAALRARVSALEALCFSLQLMESEICSRLTPMREVLDMLSRQSPPRARGLYRRALENMNAIGQCSFHTIWKNAVAQSRELCLRPEEARVLSELGTCLGRYDVTQQAEAISRVRDRMETFLRRAGEERDRDWKLHAFFGLASGAFAVIILL